MKKTSRGRTNIRTPGYLALSALAFATLQVTQVLAQDIPVQEMRQDLHDMLPDDVKTAGAIIATGSFDNPPGLYADVNDPSKAVGIAPSLGNAVGEVLGVKVEWRNTQWPGQLPGVDGGTFDVAWGQVSVTEQRERELYDLIPWSAQILGFLVPESNPEGIVDWTTACGHSVAVTLGSIFVQTMNNASDVYCTPAGLERITVLEYQGDEVTAVRSGQADATIDNFVALDHLAANMGGFEAVQLPEEQSREFYSGLAGIAVKKDNVALTQALIEALRIIHENGTWQAIVEANDAVSNLPSLDLIKANVLSGTPMGERNAP